MPAPLILLNEHFEHDGPIVFAHACRLGLEGIVSKRKDSLSPRPLAGLAQVKEPGQPGSAPGGGGRLGQVAPKGFCRTVRAHARVRNNAGSRAEKGGPCVLNRKPAGPAFDLLPVPDPESSWARRGRCAFATVRWIRQSDAR
jgi:hypothetical protein